MKKSCINFIKPCNIFCGIWATKKIKIKEGLKDCRVIERVYTNHSSNGQLPKPFPASVPSGDRAVVLRQLGTSANGFGMLGVRQNLWADPAINAVSFIHRMHIPPHTVLGQDFLHTIYRLMAVKPGRTIFRFMKLLPLILTGVIRRVEFIIHWGGILIQTMLIKLILQQCWTDQIMVPGGVDMVMAFINFRVPNRLHNTMLQQHLSFFRVCPKPIQLQVKG